MKDIVNTIYQLMSHNVFVDKYNITATFLDSITCSKVYKHTG